MHKKRTVVGALLIAVLLVVAVFATFAAAKEEDGPAVELWGPLLLSAVPDEHVTATVDGEVCHGVGYLTPNSPRPDVCALWPVTETITLEGIWTAEQLQIAQGEGNGVAFWSSGVSLTVKYADGYVCSGSSVELNSANIYKIEATPVTTGAAIWQGEVWDTAPQCNHTAQVTPADLRFNASGVPFTFTVQLGLEKIWKRRIEENGVFTVPLPIPESEWTAVTTVQDWGNMQLVEQRGWLWHPDPAEPEPPQPELYTIFIPLIAKAPQQPEVEVTAPLLFEQQVAEEYVTAEDGTTCWGLGYLSSQSPRPDTCVRWQLSEPAAVKGRWTKEQLDRSGEDAALWSRDTLIEVTYANGVTCTGSSVRLEPNAFKFEFTPTGQDSAVWQGEIPQGSETDCPYSAADVDEVNLQVSGELPANITLFNGSRQNSIVAEAPTATVEIEPFEGWSRIATTVWSAHYPEEVDEQHGYMWQQPEN